MGILYFNYGLTIFTILILKINIKYLKVSHYFLFDIFKIKYVGSEQENKSLQMAGLNLMDKTLSFGEARIAFSIWDVGGN